jgi:hypothetical protein
MTIGAIHRVIHASPSGQGQHRDAIDAAEVVAPRALEKK